jgi:hypothetical protein
MFPLGPAPLALLLAAALRRRRHFQQQGKDRLGIKAMPEIVGVVDAIARKIDVLLIMLDRAAI